MITFVCDDGSTATKIAWADESGEIQAVACSNAARQGKTITAGKLTVVETEGQIFTFSDSIPGRLKTHSANYQTGAHSRAAVWAALYSLGLVELIGKGGARCVATLPISQFYAGAAGVNDRLIEAKKENLLKPVTINGQVYKFKDVAIYPEGLPVAAAYLEDESGPTVTREEKTLIVDIGGTTTDIAFVYGANDHVEKVNSLTNISGNQITEGLRSRLAAEFSVIDDQALEALIRSGESKSLGVKAADYGLDQVVAGLADSLINELLDVVQDPRTVSRLIIVGGPAALFVSALESAGFPLVINPESSQTILAKTIFKIESE